MIPFKMERGWTGQSTNPPQALKQDKSTQVYNKDTYFKRHRFHCVLAMMEHGKMDSDSASARYDKMMRVKYPESLFLHSPSTPREENSLPPGFSMSPVTENILPSGQHFCETVETMEEINEEPATKIPEIRRSKRIANRKVKVEPESSKVKKSKFTHGVPVKNEVMFPEIRRNKRIANRKVKVEPEVPTDIQITPRILVKKEVMSPPRSLKIFKEEPINPDEISYPPMPKLVDSRNMIPYVQNLTWVQSEQNSPFSWIKKEEGENDKAKLVLSLQITDSGQNSWMTKEAVEIYEDEKGNFVLPLKIEVKTENVETELINPFLVSEMCVEDVNQEEYVRNGSGYKEMQDTGTQMENSYLSQQLVNPRQKADGATQTRPGFDAGTNTESNNISPQQGQGRWDTSTLTGFATAETMHISIAPSAVSNLNINVEDPGYIPPNLLNISQSSNIPAITGNMFWNEASIFPLAPTPTWENNFIQEYFFGGGIELDLPIDTNTFPEISTALDLTQFSLPHDDIHDQNLL